jgi:hypothetical protein
MTAQGTRLDLTLILEQIISLDNGHRKFTIDVLTNIFVPKETVLLAC